MSFYRQLWASISVTGVNIVCALVLERIFMWKFFRLLFQTHLYVRSDCEVNESQINSIAFYFELFSWMLYDSNLFKSNRIDCKNDCVNSRRLQCVNRLKCCKLSEMHLHKSICLVYRQEMLEFLRKQTRNVNRSNKKWKLGEFFCKMWENGIHIVKMINVMR